MIVKKYNSSNKLSKCKLCESEPYIFISLPTMQDTLLHDSNVKINLFLACPNHINFWTNSENFSIAVSMKSFTELDNSNIFGELEKLYLEILKNM